ncbi:MAG: response regulator, partial [Bacteroidaceae bacterium]|nr:response regulator [Bacteroidaceae bacterium]
MRVLIIEDETAASENLIAMLQEIDSEIEVLKVLESVQQTVRWLSSNSAPDLIFMDIHLSDGSAFTLFQEIEVTVPIVFTTAYDQYALDAFTVNSIDYLLKPIKTSELKRALDKFKRWTHNDVMDYLQRMMKMRMGASSDNITSFLVPVRDKLVPVSMSDV